MKKKEKKGILKKAEAETMKGAGDGEATPR